MGEKPELETVACFSVVKCTIGASLPLRFIGA